MSMVSVDFVLEVFNRLRLIIDILPHLDGKLTTSQKEENVVCVAWIRLIAWGAFAMASKIHINGGKVEAVYDDRFLPLFQALGTMTVTRATEVEFDHASGEWIATHIATKQVIARGTNRSQVIQDEVKWLEENYVA
jgi:hypothetical protein